MTLVRKIYITTEKLNENFPVHVSLVTKMTAHYKINMNLK